MVTEATITPRGTTKITVELTYLNEDVDTGWFGDERELGLSVLAALFEVQGDDGGAYVPEDKRVVSIERGASS